MMFVSKIYYIYLTLLSSQLILILFSVINFQGYLPFYVLYYVFLSLQLQFANSALGIGRRYRRLNITLKNAFPESKYK